MTLPLGRLSESRYAATCACVAYWRACDTSNARFSSRARRGLSEAHQASGSGAIVEISEPEEFFTNPKSDRAKKFLNLFSF